MSLFGAMTTAIGGLTAQSRALGHISDNVANSQTVGFKRIDTSFVSYITSSTERLHAPGSVVARPDFTNTVQGTIEQTENRTSLAVAGQGFFAVASQNGEENSVPTFDSRPFYTRAGDFALDRNGYLVNSAGYFLQGWGVDAETREIDRTEIAPIRVSQLVSTPVATNEVILAANLPASAADGQTQFTSSIPIYDALGNSQQLDLEWTKSGSNNWRLDVTTAGSSLDPVGGASSITGFDDQAISAFNVQATVQPARQTTEVDIPDPPTTGTIYSTTINGIVISHTATATDTATTVRNQLVSAINTDSATLGVTAVIIDNETFEIRAVNSGTAYTLTLTNATEGVQTAEIDLSTPVDGTTYTVTVDGNPYSYTAAAGDTATTVRDSLIASIGTVFAGVSAVDSNTLKLRAPDTVTPFTLTTTNTTIGAQNDNIAAAYQTDSFVFTGSVGEEGDTYAITLPSVNGVAGDDRTWTYTTTGDEGSMNSIANGVAALINSDSTSPGLATVQGGILTIVAKSGVPIPTWATPLVATTNGTIPPNIGVTFGAGGDPTRAGTITAISGANVAGGTASVPTNQTTGDPAYVDLTLNYGQGEQNVRIYLGTFGQADGVTQFAGSDYAVRSQEQNGVPQGSFSSLTISEVGDVIINYDNGQSRVINRVPVVTFNEADKLDRVDGQAFMRTTESGEARVLDPSRDGAGKLVVGSIERSNVDIASEFSKLIIAQRAYTASTRIVTASDEMLQDTLNMKR